MSRIKEKVYKCYIRVKYTLSLNQGINMSYKEAKKILDDYRTSVQLGKIFE